MKIKRFTAPNLRDAMRLVREEQGPDAVILSNRRVDDGFEVVAATDYDAAMLQHAAGRDTRAATPAPAALVAAAATPLALAMPSEPAPSLSQTAELEAPKSEARLPGVPAGYLPKQDTATNSAAATKIIDKPADKTTDRPLIFPKLERESSTPVRIAASAETFTVPMLPPRVEAARMPEPVAVVAPTETIEPIAPAAPIAIAPAVAAPIEIDQLKAEMQTMRRFMEQQLAIITRGEPAAPRHPIRADVVRALIDLGVESKLAREIASEISEGVSSERARQQALGVLARRIPAFKHEWLDAGGVVALVGATGVGKTTSVAKLAARYVQSWGLRNVALITTDHFRIGAQEQLFTYGRLLGVPVLTADTPNELRLALDKLRDCKLVLIDTAGMSPRDANLEKQFAMLSSLPTPARTALVLSAGSQAGDLDAQFTRFAPANPSAVILTKLDEATRIGSAFSALARRDVPLAYVADGQRVPEDLCAARPEDLVRNAAEALRRDQATHQQTQAEVELDGVAHA